MTRRRFVGATGGVAAAIALQQASAMTPGGLRLAIVGTGDRGILDWGSSIVQSFQGRVRLVGLCDINGLRAKAARELLGIDAPTFTEFDAMVAQTKPESVLITTIDATHWRYVVRALELGVDVIVEKPLCTDEQQCQRILEAQKKSGRRITVAFNARHEAGASRVKQLLTEQAVGGIVSIEAHEYLNTTHGADYFRRWHHLKENSGTLLCHKASHHFDLVNWWLESRPVEVSAWGELSFYGRNNPFRGTHCRSCPHKGKCAFAWDINKNDAYRKLYVECESEDGYLRDGCVWREDTNIYDTMSVRVRYANGVILTFTVDTYLPYEGLSFSFNGTAGRLDMHDFGAAGYRNQELRLTRGGSSQVLPERTGRAAGEHVDADLSTQELVFGPQSGPDPLHMRADVAAGALSSLTGIAAYRSIERGGAPVKIDDLVRL